MTVISLYEREESLGRKSALADAIEERAEILLEDEEFVWDFLGDIGKDLRDQAVLAVVRAVIKASRTNPALKYRLQKLARKEAERQIKEEYELR